jgi:hypothetical protein
VEPKGVVSLAICPLTGLAEATESTIPDASELEEGEATSGEKPTGGDRRPWTNESFLGALGRDLQFIVRPLQIMVDVTNMTNLRGKWHFQPFYPFSAEGDMEPVRDLLVPQGRRRTAEERRSLSLLAASDEAAKDKEKRRGDKLADRGRRLLATAVAEEEEDGARAAVGVHRPPAALPGRDRLFGRLGGRVEEPLLEPAWEELLSPGAVVVGRPLPSPATRKVHTALA